MEISKLYWDTEFKMRQFERNGAFSKLSCHPYLPGFFFNLENIKEINGIPVKNDFKKYSFRLSFDFFRGPVIYLINQKDTILTHIYNDYSLCLFDSKKYDWTKSKSFIEDFIGLTYLWIVYLEEYQKNGGIWVGP